MKTYSYKLYPTKSQEKSMNYIIDECRLLWNCALEQRRIYHTIGGYS